MKETWQDLASAYLRGRPNLKRVYLLIDARHGLKAPDLEAMSALDEAAARLARRFPALRVLPVTGDFGAPLDARARQK